VEPLPVLDTAESWRRADAQCGKLRQYVKPGGREHWLATFGDVPHDELGGNPPRTFGMADLSGRQLRGQVERDIKNALHADRGADCGTRGCAAGGTPGGSSGRCSAVG